jgi:DNA-binding GntR family transcriptional regulator
LSKTGLAPIAQEKESLVDRVCDAVRHSIISGQLRPAEVISISDLATDLGVSHSPVREALQRLASQGLVELRPARSAIVAPLDVEELTEIYRIRKLLEVDTAGRACPLLTAGDLEAIERDFELLSRAGAGSEDIWTRHDDFHRALMGPALSPRLDRVISEQWHAGERYIRIVYADSDVFAARSIGDRHQELLDAARAGKAAGMRKALLAHLETNEREIGDQVREILAR